MSLRVAMLSVHTSPLHQPGTGDAGGMNVYMVELARSLADRGASVDLFTRCRGDEHAEPVRIADRVRVRHLCAGPCEPLPKESMRGILLEFSLALIRAGTERPYDLVHSHYWLSGQAGALASEHWQVPLVHTAHTLAKVKNSCRAPGDAPEPQWRIRGEEGVVRAADRLVANTLDEAEALVGMYGADRSRTEAVSPGVNTQLFRPGDGKQAARGRLGLPRDAFVPLFAGRIQPLKGPDVLVRAVGEALRAAPELRSRMVVPVVGGLSGRGAVGAPEELKDLCREQSVLDVMRFEPAMSQEELADWYRAADVLVVPSRSESFGLVALEAQACGTPVLAAAVGGLRTAVWDGVSGMLVPGHDPARYAQRLLWLARNPDALTSMGHAAVHHARGMSWETAADKTLSVYERALQERESGGAGAAACPCPVGAPRLEEQESRNSNLPFVLV